MKDFTFVLASSSPRRKDILINLGIRPVIQKPDIDETQKNGESPKALVARLSYEKAMVVAKQLTKGLVLGSDTVVVIDEHTLGQPKDEESARRMLKLLSGRVHEVMTGMTLVDLNQNRIITKVATTYVTMKELSESWIEDYIATGEPMDKAGSYGLQGIGSILVDHMEGEYTTVIGLSIRTLIDLLTELGIDYFQLIKS